MKICLYIKFIALLFFCCSAYSTAHDSQDNKYLLKPTGAYGIGYQDVFLINTDMVPRWYTEKMYIFESQLTFQL